MNKKLFFDLLYVILIIAVICFMAWLFFYLRTESYQCMKDPLFFFMEKTGNECFCIEKGGIGQLIPMK
jgi:hypothetical protein